MMASSLRAKAKLVSVIVTLMIVFERVLTHVDAEIKSCPHCESETRGAFPKAFAGPVQYGAGVKAYVLNLVIAQMISLKRAQYAI